MKSTIFLLIVFAFIAVNAQKTEYYYTTNPFEYDNFASNKGLIKVRMENKVKSITETTRTYKNGRLQEGTTKAVSEFNENGQLVQKDEFDAENRLIRRSTYVLNDSGWILEKKIVDGKGNALFQFNKVYDPMGNVVSYEYLKNGKLKSKYTSHYDGKYLIERSVYKKDGVNLSDKFVYSFDRDMKLQTTRLYDGKGKLKYTWNHECMPEGELMAARKDTTTVCRVREEAAEGHFVNYIKSVNDAGELTTTTIWYRGERQADSSKTVTETKNPTMSIARYTNDETSFEYYQFNKNNEILWKSASVYSSNSNCLKTEYWRRDKKHGLYLYLNTDFVEDSNGLLLKSANYSKNVLLKSTEYTYMYF